MSHIKVRAWEVKSRCMLEWITICQTAFNRSTDKGEYGIMYKVFTAIEDDFIVMRWTGVRDKEGREIYGSDIIQDLLTKVKYKVKFGYCKKYGFNGWFVENEELGIISALNGDYDTDQNSQIEVLGNIYEHPELLNQKVAT